MKDFIKKWWITFTFFALATILFSISIVLIFTQRQHEVALQQTLDALATPILSPQQKEAPAETDNSTNVSKESTPIEAYVSPYQSYFEENEDMVAWLKISDTVIDYPVMQTPQDEDYYLEKGFDKQHNVNGSLIMDTDSDVETPGTNLIIHGHNMKSGEMFGSLQDYEKEDYCKEHPLISLYVKNEERIYEICSVFYSQVYKKTDTVFKYYHFFESTTEEDFDTFYNNIKDMSLYDTGVSASYGDHFITLSTCSYQVARGRFVVIAKQLH